MNRALIIIVAMVICRRLGIYKLLLLMSRLWNMAELRMLAKCERYPHVYVVGVYFHFENDYIFKSTYIQGS